MWVEKKEEDVHSRTPVVTGRAGLFAALCVSLLLAAGCGSSSSSSSAGSSGSSTAAASSSSGGSSSPLKIASPEPYSGSSASLGQYTDQSFELAMQQYGGSKVGNRPMQLVKGDTQCTPSIAVQAIHQVLAQHPVAAISPACSGDTLAIKPLLTAQQVPTVSMDFVAGIVANDPYMWDVVPTMVQINTKFAQYIKATAGVTSVGILHDTTAYGESCAAGMVTGLKAAGLTLGANASYSPDATDFSGQILSMKKAGVQALYIEGYSEQLGAVISQVRQLGLTVPIFASLDVDDTAAFQSGGKAVNGVVFATTYLPLNTPASQAFTKEWTARFHSVPGSDVDGIYESAAVLVKALQTAGPNATSAEINHAIATTNLVLPSGTITFDPSTRERVNPPIYIGKIENSTAIEIKQL
jgi:branched-chain amino acid transport system substrate-binding protein